MSALLSTTVRKRLNSGFKLDLSFSTDSGMTILFGPSGSGKSSLLRLIAGLDRPDDGKILFGSEVWFDRAKQHNLSPQKRRVGFLSQAPAVFPHLNVERNLLSSGAPRSKALEAAKRFGISHLLSVSAKGLSGGEQQRVCLVRALLSEPSLLLLDEPLSAFDIPLRELARAELRQTLAECNIQSILVTHDPVEAIALGKNMMVIEDGKIVQDGPVQEIFSRPASATVAKITGVQSIVCGTVVSREDGMARVKIGGCSVAALEPSFKFDNVYVCIRAEDVTLERENNAPLSARNRLPGKIVSIENQGLLFRVNVDCGFLLTALITKDAMRELKFEQGTQVRAIVKAPAVHLVPL